MEENDEPNGDGAQDADVVAMLGGNLLRAAAEDDSRTMTIRRWARAQLTTNASYSLVAKLRRRGGPNFPGSSGDKRD
ncbi:MAG: hypothetical protein KGJ78_15035 [Alphaproteobacteria bacterium]|nr:hypothetical protein [Alphaproteobacteria bacterium]